MRKHSLWKRMAARLLVLAMTAGLAFPGTAFAATAQDAGDGGIVCEQDLEDPDEIAGEGAAAEADDHDLQDNSDEAISGENTSSPDTDGNQTSDPAEAEDEITSAQEEENEDLPDDMIQPDENLTDEEQPADENLTDEEQPADENPTDEEQPADENPTDEEQPADESLTDEEQTQNIDSTDGEPTDEEQSVNSEEQSAEQAVSDEETAEEAAGADTEEAGAAETAVPAEGTDVSDEMTSDEEKVVSPAAKEGEQVNKITSAYFEDQEIGIGAKGIKTAQLKFSVEYDSSTSYDTNQPYYFESSNEDVLKVDEKGMVTAVADEGDVSAYITIYSMEDGEKNEWDWITIDVNDFAYKVSFDLNGGSLTEYYEEDSLYKNGKICTDEYDIYLNSDVAERSGYRFAGWTEVKDSATVLESEKYYVPTKDTVLYAKWTKLYTVKFALNGGAWKDDYSKESYSSGLSSEKGETVYLPGSSDLSRSGYEFDGWTVTKNTDPVLDYEYTVTKDITLYAKWTPTYTVKFSVNGGKWTEYYYKNGITERKNNTIYLPGDYYIEKSGYIFKGWTTVKDGTTVLDMEYKVTKNIVLYAKWAKAYTVKFNLNGGKWTSDYYKNGISQEKNAEVYLPGDYNFEKSGYIFKGWTTTKNASTVVGSYYKITKNITLYAKWAKECKITLNAGKGYFGKNKSTHKYVLKLGYGDSVGGELSYADDPHYGSYIFAGWYKDSKLKNPVKKSDIIKKNLTYYAKWITTSYKITVTNLKGSSYTNIGTDEYVSNSTANSYSFYIRRGDSIGYFYADKNGESAYFYFDKACKTKPYYSSYVPTANTTVYAKWNGQITIKWNANGGQTPYGSKTGEAIVKKTKMCSNLPQNLYRNGYYFVGWYDVKNTSKILPASHVFTKSTTVKAKWAKAIKLTFKPNGGKISDGKSVYYVKAKAQIKNNYPDLDDRTGYMFKGWKSSVTNKVVTDIYSEKPAKATTYTAVWAKTTISKTTISVTLQAGAGSIYNWNTEKYVTKMVVKVPKNIKLADIEFWSYVPRHDEAYKKLTVVGWSTTKNGKALKSSYKITKNITLYPVWGKSTYLCTAMVTNGGSIDQTAQNTPYVDMSEKGSYIALPTASHMEREGYTLVGWYLDAALTKKVSNPKKFKVTASRYLYAKWKKK